MEWVKWVCAILSGLSVCIPLVVKLVESVRANVREKNWKQLVDLVMMLISKAEAKFIDGGERKEWVLMMVKSMSDSIEYDIDMDAVAEMIDAFVAMSKSVNAQVVIANE